MIGALFFITAGLIFWFIWSKSNYRLLEISDFKQCELGPYTWGPKDSDKYKFCSDLWSKGLDMSCRKGFHGRKAHFDYTPESNQNWENTRCEPSDKPDPRVLI